ncbi:peptidoglycan-binding protein [Candidatus Nomurabacteria bacterium]|nr:peptidoglycan-binding protein [Candidatus Nomurabacteria bacterium]
MSLRSFFGSVMILMMLVIPSITFAGTTINGNDYARFNNPSLGAPGSDELKVNFNPSMGTKADLTTSGLTGNAWSAGTGWMQFSGTNYAVGITCDPATQIGKLNGFGWGEGSGWINFDTTNKDVIVDSNGYLDGAAWAQDTGWMIFESSSCVSNGGTGDGCVQFDFQCPGNTSGGGSSGGSLTVACTLIASDTHISSGDSVELSWNLFGTNAIALNNMNYGAHDSVTVSPTQTTLYTASVTRNNITKTCSTTITVDGQAPASVEDPTCKDPEANNYDPSGDVHNQSLCTYTFDTCFEGIDNDCTKTPDEEVTAPADPLIPTTTPTVFDPETQCDYFEGYWKKGDQGHEVAKIQDFLNRYMNAGLVVDGDYGRSTTLAVGQFQRKHSADILAPWNYHLPTNRWYKSTRSTANGIIGCLEDTVYLEDVRKDYDFDNPTLFGSFKNFITNLFNES